MFETDLAIKDMSLEKIKLQAYDLGWNVYSWEPEQRKLRLTRGKTKVDIWLTRKSTVAVMQEGKPAKYHRHVVERELDQLLDKS
ncbi:hypothetical protein A2Z56_02575 [Candidatus Kaiserbacteria bacterium RIFCSPHIGHO2_12_45_16]|nr:MAG: hypothetical protein A2Z56_02575 [Candidatus Kaiserbacteria bacterium RIFCSPHIGHO2_12_45_16]